MNDVTDEVTALDARPPSGAVVLERHAARALVLDEHDRLLLFLGHDPAQPERGSWWFTPGGGLEGDEDVRSGLAREVREETGWALDPGTVQGPVWSRSAEFRFAGRWYHQDEEFFVVRVPGFVVDTSGFEALEASAVLGHRWWTAAELAATDEVVYPRDLAALLVRLLRDGLPPTPVRIA